MEPLIITAAIVGAEVTRGQTPHLPITAVEIGEEAARCAYFGATVIHLHVRDENGSPTQDAGAFRNAIAEIRRRTDVIVQVSTGGAVGMTPEERCRPLALRPEMCTLSTGSVNFGDEVFENPRPLMARIAGLARQYGVTPEIEVFDAGFIDNARWLASKGLIDLPAHFDFVLGVPGGLAADPDALDFLIKRLPGGCSWSVAGMGRCEFPMAELAIRMGGHARVGLEDNIFIEKGVLAAGSHELVERVAGMALRHGRPLADVREARRLLRLDRAGAVD